MMKFWKSAAKGKTGCPVRPPEAATVNNSDNKIVLDTQLDNEDEGLVDLIFGKRSKLSLNLHDIIVDRKCIKYFIQFMESIGKPLVIRCWLELDNFRSMLLHANYQNNDDEKLKLSRTKSFDLPVATHRSERERSQRMSWSGEEDSYPAFDTNQPSSSSTNSNWNLYEHNQVTGKTHSGNEYSQVTEEAINLFKKYVAQEAPHELDLPDNVRKTVITNICQPEGQIKHDCFKPVQDILFALIENNHFNDFHTSAFYIKAQIDILTSGTLSLQDILYNEAILFYFTEYLEQESCNVLLEFLMAVMHFRENLMNANSVNSEQAESDAIVIYEKYISLQAINPIGFPTDVRSNIESDICREGGPLYTCFDLPYRIVFKTLTKYGKSFLESELYYKYLTEMIHSVDQMALNHKSHSDCSSEFSISTHNTLLAMGDPVFRKKKRNHSVPDMTIDSNQLYNADALWQRKRYDGLSLGRINSLGRFESKFDPDPDKKDRSMLKKMVSRFVPTNTSKVKEEMAWQIAHMIVKDVTDLTMAPPDNERDEV